MIDVAPPLQAFVSFLGGCAAISIYQCIILGYSLVFGMIVLIWLFFYVISEVEAGVADSGCGRFECSFGEYIWPCVGKVETMYQAVFRHFRFN